MSKRSIKALLITPIDERQPTSSSAAQPLMEEERWVDDIVQDSQPHF